MMYLDSTQKTNMHSNQLPISICHVTEYHAFVHLRSMVEYYVALGLHMDQNAILNANTISSTVLQCKQVVALNNKAM